MIVISDTGPLNYLALLGNIALLETLYGSVIVPKAVAAELSRPSAPPQVRTLIQLPPAWLSIVDSPPADPGLFDLGAGEQQAITLAKSLRADLLLCDDKDAREAALRMELKVVGTLGVLQEASERGLFDLHDAIRSLSKTNFRISKELLKKMLENDD